MHTKSKLTWRLVTISVVIFFLSAGLYFLFTSTSESKKLEQALIDRFGWAEQYTPEADGAFQPERLEGFIRVRQAVQSSCADFQEVLDGIVGLAAIETDPEITGEEAASRGIRGVKSMIKVGPKMLRFMDSRNSALLKEDMGIGEYIYLYLSAYGEQLAVASSSPYAEMEEAYISSRTRNEFIQILNNQLAELDSATVTETSAGLKSEIQALEDGSHASPWPDGPLPKTRESLAPYKETLSSLYCDGVAAIELLQKNRGFRLGG